jgi:two-component system, cell cycle sensor histidine kinase and response regulator CckA
MRSPKGMMIKEMNSSVPIATGGAPESQCHWWRCLFDQSEEVQVVCRADGMLFEANRKAIQLLALPETVAECRKRNFLTHLTASSATKVVDLLQRTSGSQESLLSISLLVEGKICLLADLQATPLDEGFSLITLKDANRRWRMESHVQRLMLALNATPEAIFLTDSEFRIVFVNSAFSVATGYAAEDVLGKKMEVLLSPESFDQGQACLASVKRGEHWRGELVNKRADGVNYTVDATISPLYDAEGMLNGYVAFERDAERRQRLQQELSGEPGKKVADQNRIRELEQQLYQAQKMETVGALAAGAAHDFNNLLQVISGNVSLLSLDAALSDSMRRKVQQIEQASTRASTITQQLLSLSRASDEKIAVVDFNQIIQETRQLPQLAPGGDIELELAPACRPALVCMESALARQIVLNLCVSALDGMPHGGRLVLGNRLFKLAPEQAARTPHPQGTDFVCCSVTDTGAVISREKGNQMFDPVFTTKEQGRGTGLDLSMIHDLVSQAHGFIEVESEPGQGTVFKLCMPSAHAELAAEVKPAQPAPRTGSGRLLVVDDLDLVLELTVSFLRTAGYEVLPAASAEAALEILQTEQTPIDLLFTDYNMKGMNGGQLIAEAAARSPKMKFIMASGFLSDADRQHLQGIANVRIIDKPFKMREASAMIAEALAPRQEYVSTDS